MYAVLYDVSLGWGLSDDSKRDSVYGLMEKIYIRGVLKAGIFNV